MTHETTITDRNYQHVKLKTHDDGSVTITAFDNHSYNECEVTIEAEEANRMALILLCRPSF